jgi:hypothetical protein
MSTGWGYQEPSICIHEQTTDPDDDGYVVCCACLLAIRRPYSQAELNRRLLGGS